MQFQSDVQYIVTIDEMQMLFHIQDMLPMLFFASDVEADDSVKGKNEILAKLYGKGYVEWLGEQLVCTEPMRSILHEMQLAERCMICDSYAMQLHSFIYYKNQDGGVLIRTESSFANTFCLERLSVNELKNRLEQVFEEEFHETAEELFEEGNPEGDQKLLTFEIRDKKSGDLISSLSLVENGISDIMISQETRMRFSRKELAEMLGL